MKPINNNKKKIRLDLLLTRKGLAPSRQRAKALILGGKVLVDKNLVDKAGALVSIESQISIRGSDNPYVSRGGLKLEEALKVFPIKVNNCKCLDVGASTGGFTDCLLQHGAKHVVAVDVGYGQLDWKLRNHPNVTVFERTNIRYLADDAIDTPVDLITIDTSFISLKIVIPAIIKFLKNPGFIIALIKPQFEVGKGKVGKGGVVRDPDQHKEVIDDLINFFKNNELEPVSVIPSPILGPKGNKEFLICLRSR